MEELDDIIILLRRHLAGKLTESEREQLAAWSARHSANRSLLESLADEESLLAGYTDYLQIYDEAVSCRLRKIEDSLMKSINPAKESNIIKTALSRWLPYVAAILLAALIGVWVFYGDYLGERRSPIATVQDIMAGGNRATLTLADGRTIVLDETRDGIVVGSEGITYSDGDPLAEQGGYGITRAEFALLELSTPAGGTYQITLPDGSQVWLNAASTLTYPMHFSGAERKVRLSGEAYFSVAKDTGKPFKVASAGQEVQVLGTAFNVSAYPDGTDLKTTLVEGKVGLSLTKQLHAEARGQHNYIELFPGEQAVLKNDRIVKHKVDTELYTAWKNGYFYFDRTPLEEVLRQAARWYDVEVIYPNGVPSETFSGDISRNVSLLGLLKILQLSTIDIKLQGKTLIVN